MLEFVWKWNMAVEHFLSHTSTTSNLDNWRQLCEPSRNGHSIREGNKNDFFELNPTWVMNCFAATFWTATASSSSFSTNSSSCFDDFNAESLISWQLNTSSQISIYTSTTQFENHPSAASSENISKSHVAWSWGQISDWTKLGQLG